MSEANASVDNSTLHGKFILAKRGLIGDIQLADIQRMVAAAGGWEAPDAAVLQKAYGALSVPLHKLTESKDDQAAYDQCTQALQDLNATLRPFVEKYKDAPALVQPSPVEG